MDKYEKPTIKAVETENPDLRIPVAVAVAAVAVYVVAGTIGAAVVAGATYIGLVTKP